MISEKELSRREKISKTLKAKYTSGEYTPWSRGKTKETDSTIREMANKKKGTKMSKECRRKRSESQKKYMSNPANRLRLSKSMKKVPHTPEWNQKVALANTGRIRSKEFCERVRQGSLGKKLSKEHRYNISLGVCKAITGGRHNPIKNSYGRSNIYTDIHGNVHHFKSLAERSCAEMLEASGLEFEYEKYSLPYNGRRYIPDFYVKEYDCFIEVKHINSIDDLDEDNLLKILLARIEGHAHIHVWSPLKGFIKYVKPKKRPKMGV